MNDAPRPAMPLPARRLRAANRLASQCAWLFAVALFGYALVGNAVSLLQIDSRDLTVPFRTVVALFSVWLIVKAPPFKSDALRKAMFVIWFLYVLRLLYDWLGPNLEGADYALQFFLATSVLPAIALMKAREYRNRQYARIAFWVASAGALISLLAAVSGGVMFQNAEEGGGRLRLVAIDPVSLGNQALAAILCALVLWRNARSRFRVVLAAVTLLMLWCLVLTGSKGPALALLFCAGLWALRRGYASRFALLAVPLIVWVLASSDNALSARFAESADDPSTLDRLLIFNDSLAQIANAPLLGSAFVELNSGYYPHDIFVEAGLAFGIPVAIGFSALVLIGGWRAWKTLDTDFDLLGLLYIQGLFAGAISGAIYASFLLWVTLALLPPMSGSGRMARRGLSGAEATEAARDPPDGRRSML